MNGDSPHPMQDRYDRLRLIPWWDQQRLRRARVLVVGAGAIGNETIKNLALLGVGEIFICDRDRVELSNLTRSVLFRQSDCGRFKAEVAAESARQLNPDVRTHPLVGDALVDLGLGLFRAVQVVIGCLDNRETRLWVNRSCWKTTTPWIDGGIAELAGVVKVFVPPHSACYECGMTENDYRLINLRYSCPQLPRSAAAEGKTPTTPTSAALVAALQVQEALKLLHGLPVEAGKAVVFNGVANSLYTTEFQRRTDCLSHETYGEPLAAPLGRDHTAEQLFQALRRLAPADVRPAEDEPLRMTLDRDLVVTLSCQQCGRERPVHRPAVSLLASEAVCPQCGQMSSPQRVHLVGERDPLARLPLRMLGVPPYDILRICSAGEREWYVLLEQDETRVLRADSAQAERSVTDQERERPVPR